MSVSRRTATWFVKAVLTVFVCEDTRCGDKAPVSAEIADRILNVDKVFFGGFSVDAEESVIGGGGSNPINPNAAYETIVSQFGLGSGSLVTYLVIAIVTAVAPFVMAYVFLRFHQRWLRQRVTGESDPARPHAGNAGVPGLRERSPQEGSSQEGKKPASGRCMDKSLRKVLLAGLAATAFVVLLPMAILAFDGDGALHEFDEDFASSCPACINGVPSAGYLEATAVAGDTHTVRSTLMTQAARVREREREREREVDFA